MAPNPPAGAVAVTSRRRSAGTPLESDGAGYGLHAVHGPSDGIYAASLPNAPSSSLSEFQLSPIRATNFPLQ